MYYSFVDVSVLQLHKSSANGGDVRLLIAKRHTSSSFRILQLRIDVDASVTNAAVKPIHN